MSFVTLHTGLSGLRAAQTGVDVTANNIANASTPGYTRQRVELRPKLPYSSPVGQVGTGVEVDDIVRLRDTFMDSRVRSAIGEFARHDTRASVLENLEVVLGEPDNGITSELNETWAALEDLVLDPSDPASRSVVLNQLSNLTARIREVAGGTASLLAATRSTRGELVAEGQDLIDQLADLNRRVAGSPKDEVSNQLLDQRDVLADRLAGLLGATSTLQANGTYTVTVGGASLVSGSTGATLAVTGDDVTVDGTVIPATALGGELGGVQLAVTEDVPATLAAIDDVAAQLADAFNAQHAAGFTQAGAAGGPLLSYTAGQAGATLSVAVTAIGDLALQGSSTAGRHDATNAMALADLRTATRADGQTHDEALRSGVVSLGARVASSQRAANAAAEIATTAEVNRSSAHGVSIDEEMVSLVQYQRSLEANARVMTAADEMLELLVTRLGLVGR